MKNGDKEKKRKITITLNENLIENLKILAIREKTSSSAIINELVAEYLESKGIKVEPL